MFDFKINQIPFKIRLNSANNWISKLFPKIKLKTLFNKNKMFDFKVGQIHFQNLMNI